MRAPFIKEALKSRPDLSKTHASPLKTSAAQALNSKGPRRPLSPASSSGQIPAKSKSNKYYASVVVEQEKQFLPLTGKKIGIDLGLKDLMTLSNGVVIKRSNFLRENQSKIKKAQQHLSRKSKDSNRYEKQRIKLAKLQEMVANKREWFTHNITKAIIKNYDVICVETLSSKDMQSFSSINKVLSEVSLYEVARQLEYKADWYGREILQIDRFFPSSKICNFCGNKNTGLKLADREWTCQSCGDKVDRDINAAKNILEEGLRIFSGRNDRDSSPMISALAVS